MLDSTNHAHKGSLLAKDILCSFGCFSGDEIDKISQSIYNHSDKNNKNTLFDEILKDADVLQQCLYNPLTNVPKYIENRFKMLKEELGLI